MAVRDIRVCVKISWLFHTNTNTTSFPKPLITFLTCFSRGERQKYTRKKVRLDWISNSQPPGHEFDMLTTEPLGWAQVTMIPRKKAFENTVGKGENAIYQHFVLFPQYFCGSVIGKDTSEPQPSTGEIQERLNMCCCHDMT